MGGEFFGNGLCGEQSTVEIECDYDLICGRHDSTKKCRDFRTWAQAGGGYLSTTATTKLDAPPTPKLSVLGKASMFSFEVLTILGIEQRVSELSEVMNLHTVGLIMS